MAPSAVADDVFRALSNRTRREVLERLSAGPATVSELASPFDMRLPSFMQHLSVLEQSRLVRSRKRGRMRTYEIAPERFEVVEDWLTARRRQWEARLDRFDRYVQQLEEKESGSRASKSPSTRSSTSPSSGSSTLPRGSSGKR